jgi:hypothetical protein
VHHLERELVEKPGKQDIPGGERRRRMHHLERELVENAGKQDIPGGGRRRRFEEADASQYQRLVRLAQQRSTVVEVVDDAESK